MVNTKTCEWLIDKADAPIRYRVAREFLKDENTAEKIERELLDHKAVQQWLNNLKPHDPPQHHWMVHASFDFCLENAMPKVVQLGLHGRMPRIKDAVEYHIKKIPFIYLNKPFRKHFEAILVANFLSMAAVKDELTSKFMLDILDEMYNFTKQNNYDIYISKEERGKLTGIPSNWKERSFIKPELVAEYGYGYPMIYDIVGLYRLYDLNNPEVDKKINNIINYISTDEFHSKISDGYGILIDGEYVSGNKCYHGMGWDPKYPGWFNVSDYIENINAPKLLFFAEYIALYPTARKTKWFNDLLDYLEQYKTKNNTYLFPKDWLKETSGYAVQGHHISFGENRNKKNWREIESTFYVQLLQQKV